MGRTRRRPALVTAKDLADRLGCDRRTIAKWQDEGLPVAVRGRGGRPSRYDLEACEAWKAARDLAGQEDGPIDLARERARKERAQAQLAEQLFAVRSKSLLPAAEVLQAWTREITAARSVILQSYVTAADRVYRASATDGLAGVEREMKAVAMTVLRELASPPPPSPRRRRKVAA